MLKDKKMTEQTPQVNEVSAENLLEKVKNIGMLLKNKKYFKAIKEIFILLFAAYKKYIKGRYLEIKGKKVPLIAIIIIALAGSFAVLPSDETAAPADNNSKVAEETTKAADTKEKEDANTYDKDGVKVYGLVKCDNAICGYLENDSENDISRILISVTFNDKSGAVIYEGGAEATAMVAKSRSRFTIPATDEFESFHLTDVTVER